MCLKTRIRLDESGRYIIVLQKKKNYQVYLVEELPNTRVGLGVIILSHINPIL